MTYPLNHPPIRVTLNLEIDRFCQPPKACCTFPLLPREALCDLPILGRAFQESSSQEFCSYPLEDNGDYEIGRHKLQIDHRSGI